MDESLDGAGSFPPWDCFQDTKHQVWTPTTSIVPIRSKRAPDTVQPDPLFRRGPKAHMAAW